ncbi:MAG: DUF3048 C-terminal domain-containing protein, partial [Clostridia bacterium]|nr:DUF3048 C-terminal domain-containing protein [Clostridia bacterium]
SSAKDITVKFAYHVTQFVYDAASNRYLRWQNGEKHIEGTTGEQLGYENVIILFCPYTYTNDSKNHIKVNDIGSGKGYYLTGGKYVEISWSKSYGDAAIKLTYSNGRELLLTPGKTNIEIVNSSSSITFNK